MGLFPKINFRNALFDSGIQDKWYYPFINKTNSGISISEELSLKYTTVSSCVMLIAGDVAKLPLVLYKKMNDGSSKKMDNHPLYNILHSAPNDEMTSFNWRENIMSHLLLWGNSFNQIQRDRLNNIIGLYPISPDDVKVIRRNSELYYIVHSATGNDRTLRKEEVFHIAGFGTNGIVGKSMVSLAKEAIALGLSHEEYAANFYKQGTHPSGILEIDGWLGENKEEFIKSFAQQYSGLGKTHSTVLLEGGVSYKPLTMSMEDARFIESQEFTQKQICGFYRVPPHKIAIHGANSNYNNLEQENQHYVDSCLSHWVTRIEQAISTQLLSSSERNRGYYVKFEMKGLLRGDTSARANFYQLLLTHGYPLNKVLELEEMNPVEGGDDGLVQLNLVPISQIDEVHKNENSSEEVDNEEIRRFIDRSNETASILQRDRVVSRYRPIFKHIADEIVRKEVNAIRKKLGKRSNEALETWVKEFYQDMLKFINRKYSATFLSFAEAIRDVSEDQIGEVEVDLEKFAREYTQAYAERHAGSSREQILALLRDGIEDAVSKRIEEWQEKRSEKIATNETTRLSNAVYQLLAFSAGFSTVWRTRGAQTCQYCMELSGKAIYMGQAFLNDGDKINVGNMPMKINGRKQHPPLHAGCDCYLGISIGKKQ